MTYYEMLLAQSIPTGPLADQPKFITGHVVLKDPAWLKRARKRNAAKKWPDDFRGFGTNAK